MVSKRCKSLGLIVLLIMTATTGIPAYTYTHPTGPDPDISWIPLGNSQGHLLITELPANLPIINTMRSPATGMTVVNDQTQLSYTYATTGSTKTGYSPSAYANVEGVEPVVSYMKSGTRTTVWPLQMTPVSRQWLQESNILETVTGTADFQLTTDDFVSSTHDILVRIFTLKNLSATTQSFRILHYLPINPSGRDNYAWEANWKNMASTNSVTYDSASDCMVFRLNPNPVWIVGADQRSSGHECATYPTVQNDITASGTLSNTKSAGPAVLDAALSYDSPQLAQGASFTVTAFIGISPASTPTATALTQFTAAKSSGGTNLRDTTQTFWQNWLNAGLSGQIKDAAMKKLVRRLLTVLKACTWDIGGISAVPAELSQFYTRDGMPTPRAFALFGYPADAKKILLAHEAYMTIAGDMNAQTYNSAITAKINAGFTDATAFSDVTTYSADDPDVALFTIGEVWNTSGKSDTAWLRQEWPFMKWLVGRGVPNMGVEGTIAENSGFQDDMLWYAWNRPGAGVECSYFNMLWVSGLTMASTIATTLGHAPEAKTYDSLATLIRNNLETKFWSNTYHDYAYIHVPDNRTINAGTAYNSVADGSGGFFIYPSQPHLNPYGCIAGAKAFPYWYHYASDAHARASLDSTKAILEPLQTNDLVTSGFTLATWNLEDFFYAQAAANDATLETTKNWFVRNVPLAGMPEVMPTNDRSVQIWTTGETVCALYKYLETTNGFNPTAVRQTPMSKASTPSQVASLVRINQSSVTYDVNGAGTITMYDLTGRSIARTRFSAATNHGTLQLSNAAAGTIIGVVQTTSGRLATKIVLAK